MKEFMLLIKKPRTDEDNVSEEFLKACEAYIDRLKADGNLISAQPIESEDNMVLSKSKTWKLAPINESKVVIGGYYHLRVEDLEEAISIAKENPEFAYHPTAKIEFRPIKTQEEDTGFVYPIDTASDVRSGYDEMELSMDDLS